MTQEDMDRHTHGASVSPGSPRCRLALAFGTSSAEARKAAALELMEKLEAPGLHDPEAVAAKRRCLEESLDYPVFAKTGQISGILAHEEWRRLVAASPPGNPQCLAPAPRRGVHCVWACNVRSTSTRCESFLVARPCALSPASRRMACCWRAHILLHSLREACPFCGAWRSLRVRGSSSIARIVRPGVTRRIVRLAET